MFISKGFGGRASDKFIVENSRYLDYLLPGDKIMADMGFDINDLLFPLRVNLNIPALTKEKAACRPGYFGTFCNRTCPSGTYGPLCGGSCKLMCSDYECDYIHGCPGNNKTTIKTTITGNLGENANSLMDTLFSSSKDTVYVSYNPTKRTIQKSINLLITTMDITAISKKNVDYRSARPRTESEFNALYLVFGVGALISLLLFIIIIQHCKKSSRRQTISLQTPDNNTLHGGSLTHGSSRGYNIISEQIKDHPYQSVEDQYAEINESLEMNIPNTSTAQDDYETRGASYKSSPVAGEYHNTENDSVVENIPEIPEISRDSSNAYLKPIFIPEVERMLEKNQDKVYVNVE